MDVHGVRTLRSGEEKEVEECGAVAESVREEVCPTDVLMRRSE